MWVPSTWLNSLKTAGLYGASFVSEQKGKRRQDEDTAGVQGDLDSADRTADVLETQPVGLRSWSGYEAREKGIVNSWLEQVRSGATYECGSLREETEFRRKMRLETCHWGSFSLSR